MTTATSKNTAQMPQVADTSTRGRVSWWVIFWLAALMVITIAVRLNDPVGWLGSDDAAYHSAAEHVLRGQPFHRVHHQFARSPVVLAVAASMWLFGDSPSALALPMLTASVLCVLLVVALGRLLWGWWEGLCAGAILSFIPVFQNASTCVMPGVHACLWATIAITLALVGTRLEFSARALAWAVACGLILGVATSAKVFALFAGVGVLLTAWTSGMGSRRRRIAWLGCVAVGLLAFVLLEGVFHAWAADDFWYKLHAIHNTQAGVEEGTSAAQHSLASLAAFIWDRLSMPLRTAQSGWGLIGMLFWPATLGVLLLDRRGRGIAAWAIATYLLVAFAPVSLKNGPRLFPWFDGRNILVVCVPFALCLAWVLHRLSVLALRPVVVRGVWPVLLAGVVLCSGVDRVRLNRTLGFHQQDLARAIERLVDATQWDNQREIFMPPSLYWRYRVLFPADLRSRLRVAADKDAPPWWRDTTVDMISRWKSLPPPGEAYLAVTPAQLNSQGHVWDYGVTLPREGIREWQLTSPTVTVSRFEDGTIDLSGRRAERGEEILLLLGGDPEPTPAVASRPL
jgi:hypothetical protein